MISAARLAWLQLRRQKVRLVVALAGVGFAVILMYMQLGFRDALFDSTLTVPRRLRADIVMLHPQYTTIVRPTYFPRVRLYQALGFDGVASVTPVYMIIAGWKNPATGDMRDIFLLGIDPVADAFDDPDVSAHTVQLRYPDAVMYDAYSRPEFGPVPALFDAGGSVTTEMEHRDVRVVGLFRMGTSFGIDGTVLTSDLNFLRIARRLSEEKVGMGLIRLRPGADPERVVAAMRAHLANDVQVVTAQGMLDLEIDYWSRSTPIGFVFGFGVVMGLVVGMIIVYQILFADISDHLKEYATLKAMGYTNRYLSGVVLMEASFLGIAGFVPGVAICARLFALARSATMLPMAVEPVRASEVLALTLVMCWGSALIAMRKLRSADPADVF